MDNKAMTSGTFIARRIRLPLVIFVIVVIIGTSILPGVGKPLIRASSAQGQNRLVLAFYYAWYSPGSFGNDLTPFQPGTPYYSTDASVIQRHVDEARAAGIDAFVQSWYGPTENQTESNFQSLLSIASANNFRAAIDFETGGPFFSSNQDRISALTTLLASHAQHPAYLKVDGKPIIFFWANWLLSVEEWRSIREAVDPGYSSIWIAEGGHTDYLSVFDGLHLYNVAWSSSPGGVLSTWANRTRSVAGELGAYKYWIATAMPGFNDSMLGRGESSIVRERNDGNYFRTSFAGAAATSPDMIIITSFNEWREGSNIEPSIEFGRFYLELSALLSATFKAGGVPSAPVSERSAQATLQPTAEPIDLLPTPEVAATSSPLPFVSPTPNSDGSIFYQVQPGDTLILIADKFRISLEQLLRLNQIDEESILSIGQRLIIEPSSTIQEQEFSTEFPDATMEPDGTFTYEVKENDTLIQIALKYDLTLEEILELNPDLTRDSLLRIGQELVVGIDTRPEEIGGSTTGAPPTHTPTGTRLAQTTTPVIESPPATIIAESILVTPTESIIAIVESDVTRQATVPHDQNGFFATPQLFILLVAVLAILGSGFLYLGRRS